MGKKNKTAFVNDEEAAVPVSKPVTPLPMLQICVVCSVQMAEAMNVELLFPFLAFMVEDMGYTGEQLGYHAGILAATFCGAQFCTSVAWGMISDRYGRRFAVVSGTLGAGIGMLIFGFAKTFPQAILGRIVGGLLCGNLGVVKSFLTEVTDDTNRSAAFYLFSLSWAVGSVCAPLIGGLLCKPAEKYPAIFPSGPGSIWVKFPYLLPCLLTVGISVFGAVLCMIFMIETRGMRKDDKGSNVTVTSTQHSELHGSEMDSLEEGVQMIPFPTSSTTTTSGSNSPTRGRSTSVAGADDSSIRTRSHSTEKHTAMAIGSRASKAERSGEYSRLPVEGADADHAEYTTDYDSTLVHRRAHDNTHPHSAGHSSSNSSASSAHGSKASLTYSNLFIESVPEHELLETTLTTSTLDSTMLAPSMHTARDGLEYDEYDFSLPESSVNKLHFAPGQDVATTATTSIAGRVRNRSRSTSDGQDRYVHMSTADLEASMRVPSGATQTIQSTIHNNMHNATHNTTHNTTHTSAYDTIPTTHTNTIDRTTEHNEDGDELSDEDEPDTYNSEDPEEVCCPTFFDYITELGRYLSCTTKTRMLDNSMESSSHGLMESDSNNSLSTLQTDTNTDTSGDGKLSTAAILTQRVVILATLNYGMVCASSILIDETLPLYLKLDSDHGGFGFDSTQIGTLLSTGAAGMMALTVLTMPLTNGVSNKWLSKMGILVSVPLCLSFPFIALLNNSVLNHTSDMVHMWLLWPLLILVNTLKNLFSCFTFTSAIIMVNHSVTDEYLGAVNGLGQSLGALARCLGPAVGGLLWSVATKYDFVYLNFIAVTVIFALNYYVSHLVPQSLDHRKKGKRAVKKR